MTNYLNGKKEPEESKKETVKQFISIQPTILSIFVPGLLLLTGFISRYFTKQITNE